MLLRAGTDPETQIRNQLLYFVFTSGNESERNNLSVPDRNQRALKHCQGYTLPAEVSAQKLFTADREDVRIADWL